MINQPSPSRCECTGPGYCVPANRVFSHHEFVLCRDRPELRGLLHTRDTRLEDPPLPCQSRGDVVRQERCQLRECHGGPYFDVFACDTHGECSLKPRGVRGLAVCKGCRDRKDLPPPIPPGDGIS